MPRLHSSMHLVGAEYCNDTGRNVSITSSGGSPILADALHATLQDVTDSVFYDEFGRIMMNAPVVGLDFTRYLPVIIVPYALLQVGALNPEPFPLSLTGPCTLTCNPFANTSRT